MNTLDLLNAKAENLSQYLPDGCVFTIGAAYNGYQLRYHVNGQCDSTCGYEKKSTAIAQFDALSTFRDALFKTKSTKIQVDNRLTGFNDYIEENCPDLHNQASMLSKLAYLLMLELNDDKVNNICQKAIQEGWDQGFFEVEAQDD